MDNNIEYIEVTDINDKKIKLNKELPLYYEDNDEYYTFRVDFENVFKTLENYLLSGYEPIDINEFDPEQLKKDEFNGKFINKIVLNDGSVLDNIYSFIGFESKNVLKLVPVKIQKLNKYTVDPLKVQSINWYYLESDLNDDDFITLQDVLDDIEEA